MGLAECRYAMFEKTALFVQIIMEAYRSGHNGPHSKCGYRLKRYKGSNPFASAKKFTVILIELR